MSKTNTGVEPISHERREVIRAAGVATLTGVASSLLASASPATAQQNQQ
jgi:hypothetical protein